jgi:hypothetical protein
MLGPKFPQVARSMPTAKTDVPARRYMTDGSIAELDQTHDTRTDQTQLETRSTGHHHVRPLGLWIRQPSAEPLDHPVEELVILQAWYQQGVGYQVARSSSGAPFVGSHHRCAERW